MRGKKALINTMVAMLQEIVAVACGFILPKLILSAYGSTYNGITSSITQFLGCAVLLRAGIGGATRAALYKPIADNDTDKINAIMSATNKYMHKIAYILGGLIIGFACIYPFFVLDEFDWIFSFSLFIIIGISTFAESLFGITYLILLQADQKLYISSLFQILIYVLNTALAAVLIYSNASIHVVKLGSSIVFALYPIFLSLYVRRHYKLNMHTKPDYESIGQRWDAFFHQVANFVMINTDVIVLTIFSSMLEVSVYAVYNLVVGGLKKLVQTFTTGLEAAFGSLIANDEKESLRKNFSIIEVFMFCVSTVVYTCAGLLILQFVSLYTSGIIDVEYQRPVFAVIIIISQFFFCIRQPYQLVVQAAGHYKQTKNGAIIEPVLNIVISVLLVIRYGLVGVAVGTLIAAVFRTVQYAYYVSRNLIEGSFVSMCKNCIISFLEISAIVGIYFILPLSEISNYFMLIVHGIIILVLAIIIIIVFSYLFYRDELIMMKKKLKGIVLKKLDK